MNFKIPTFLWAILLLSACSGNKLLTGRKHYEQGEYFQTAENFREVYPKLKSREEKAEVVYKLGKSYWQMGDYSKALPWLKNAIRYQYPDENLELNLAETYKASGKHDESIPLFESYLDLFPDDPFAQNGMEGVGLFKKCLKEPSLYQVKNESRLNSPRNERAFSFWDDEKKVLLASSRDNASGKLINPVDGQKYADFFLSNYDSTSQKWTFPKLLDNPEVNSSSQESHVHFSTIGQKLVFSRTTYSSMKSLTHQLYVGVRHENDWDDFQSIPFSNDGFDYPQASWSADGKWLYFSSNRDGGQGGYDIWKSRQNEQGGFDEPINLGKTINSPGNEIYPFERHKDVLYFSSDFYPGAGAQDIFKATRERGEWKIRNVGLPLNSFADDVGIVFASEGEKGFLISNRKGSRGFDIYRFLLTPRLFMCFGKVFNEETDSVISNVNIRVMGTDGMVKRLVTNNGKFQVELMPDNEYTLIAYKKGFLNAQAKISTKGLNEAHEFQLEFKQTPTDKPIRLEQIYYETGKWELLPTSMESLNKLVETLNLNPDIRIEVSAHTDEVGDEAFNQELSHKRAVEVVRYLKQQGIASNRLVAKGYGENRPYIVHAKVAGNMVFLNLGDQLSPAFISTLNQNQQEIAKSLNRRTEFEVIGN